MRGRRADPPKAGREYKRPVVRRRRLAGRKSRAREMKTRRQEIKEPRAYRGRRFRAVVALIGLIAGPISGGAPPGRAIRYLFNYLRPPRRGLRAIARMLRAALRLSAVLEVRRLLQSVMWCYGEWMRDSWVKGL